MVLLIPHVSLQQQLTSKERGMKNGKHYYQENLITHTAGR